MYPADDDQVLSNVAGVYSWRQDDPVTDDDSHYVTHDDYVTLVYLDTNFDSSVLMWGDLGTGVWLISEANLVALNFDQHFFSWDCY